MAERPGRLDATLELFGDAAREILAHPLRSLLTLSGIVFGAASLVSMTSLSAGMKAMAYRDLESIGFPRSVTVRDRGPRGDAIRAADLRHPGLRIADADALRALPGVESAMPNIWGTDLVVLGPSGRRVTPVEGVDAGYLTARNNRLVAGRDLRPLDIANASRVVVLGEAVVAELFGSTPPVGRVLTVGGVKLTVVGVVAEQVYEMAPIDNSWITRRMYVPWTFAQRYFREPGRIDQVLVTALPGADLGDVIRRAELLVRQRHGGADDFRLNNEAAEVGRNLAMADGVLGGWNAVMYAISIITILVGGIGLFSVLLISVRERVREIGIMKALGADDGDIRRLFMAESLTLAMVGAVVGVGAGAGLIVLTKWIGVQFGKDFAIPLHWPGAVFALAFAIAVGILFGWYPARRAARLDPVEAMNG
jgi:ABC-type antimicrobial peptide transport system permease subunit